LIVNITAKAAIMTRPAAFFLLSISVHGLDEQSGRLIAPARQAATPMNDQLIPQEAHGVIPSACS
jgi:hypothetical protein